MDTQNTPVHFKLWHRDFWLLAIANLFLMTSTYMLIPALPPYLMQAGFSSLEVGSIMGAYGIGIFLLGGFCSYLVQKYRRNHVCQFAISCVFRTYLLSGVCPAGKNRVLDVDAGKTATRRIHRIGSNDISQYAHH